MPVLEQIEKKAVTIEKCCSMRTVIAGCLALIVITLSVYMQVGNHPFLNYDDDEYVTNNPNVASGITGGNITWAFTSVDAANWHPVTWLSHMADAQLYGMNPRGHHITNVVIHTVSAVLLFFLLFRCTGAMWQSLFVAALFALHPLHVETVAWVSERKDVLSAFFGFLTLLLYCEYVSKPRPTLYILALCCFVTGLMSKPMLVTLPIVMLLMDFWPLNRYLGAETNRERLELSRRVTALVKEKIPFFICSLFSGIITIYAQHTGGATNSLDIIPFILRTENALISYVKYVIKTIWPHDLAILYPIPPSFPFWQVICSLSFLLLVSAAVIRAGRRFPYLTVGWFWFLVTLLPVIGLIQVGSQSMADRYSYIPMTGLFIMAAWGVPALTRGLQYQKPILALLACAVVAACTVVTWQQIGYWRDSISLFRHTLDVTTDNNVINNNLGVSLVEQGDLDAAVKEYDTALRINPDYPEAHNNLGVAFVKKGDLDAALREFNQVIRIRPADVKAHRNLAAVHIRKGDLNAAMREFHEVLRINPADVTAHAGLGAALISQGSLDLAIQEFQDVLRISPDNIDAHNNLGVALAKKGDLDAAMLEFQAALRISPANNDAQNNLERALAQKKAKDEARSK